MTQVLLCAGPGLLVVQKDGLLFYRRPGQPDAAIPYAQEHYAVFLRSAKEKHGLAPVVGPNGEEAPCIPEGLSTGEEVYRLDSSTDEPSSQKQEEGMNLPRTEETVRVPN
jgi:hypothetical protein